MSLKRLQLVKMREALCRAFFFNDTATTEIYTLSLHDALPIFRRGVTGVGMASVQLLREEPVGQRCRLRQLQGQDRKSTRLNSSHSQISYAVFCLKKTSPPVLPAGVPPHQCPLSARRGTRPGVR